MEKKLFDNWKDMSNRWLRRCPKCGKELFYKHRHHRNHLEKKKSLCYKCGAAKKRKYTNLYRNCKKCGILLEYSNPQNFYRANKSGGLCRRCNAIGNSFSSGKRTEETKEKLRVARIKRIKFLGTSAPFNPNACKYIDRINEERGWNLKHALNGGEETVSGYFLDGYDVERNIVFEYDEPYHHQKKRKEKDEIRQRNIISRLKPSLFLRYDEKNNILYTVVDTYKLGKYV
jgi:hypothetical protein